MPSAKLGSAAWIFLASSRLSAPPWKFSMRVCNSTRRFLASADLVDSSMRRPVGVVLAKAVAERTTAAPTANNARVCLMGLLPYSVGWMASPPTQAAAASVVRGTDPICSLSAWRCKRVDERPRAIQGSVGDRLRPSVGCAGDAHRGGGDHGL